MGREFQIDDIFRGFYFQFYEKVSRTFFSKTSSFGLDHIELFWPKCDLTNNVKTCHA
jgi:hypothetical protein